MFRIGQSVKCPVDGRIGRGGSYDVGRVLPRHRGGRETTEAFTSRRGSDAWVDLEAAPTRDAAGCYYVRFGDGHVVIAHEREMVGV